MEENYLSAFGEVFLYIIGATAFILVTLTMSRLIRPSRPNPEKLSTYESGEEAISSAYTQFNVRFYVVALIFLLFEVEIVFLFPWSTVFADKAMIQETDGLWGWFALIEMLVFIIVLAIGLAYAWANGFLDWIKPDPKPTEINSPVPPALYSNLNDRYSGGKKNNIAADM